MAGLASIRYPPPTPEGWKEWTWNHLVHHQAIIYAAKTVKNVDLTQYNIWPFNPDDAENWLLQHQNFHNDMDTLYQVNGSDLSTLDFTNKRDVDAWLFTNFQEHADVAQLCGLPI